MFDLLGQMQISLDMSLSVSKFRCNHISREMPDAGIAKDTGPSNQPVREEG